MVNFKSIIPASGIADIAVCLTQAVCVTTRIVYLAIVSDSWKRLLRD